MASNNDIQDRMDFLQRCLDSMDNNSLMRVLMEGPGEFDDTLLEGLDEDEIQALAAGSLAEVDSIINGRGF